MSDDTEYRSVQVELSPTERLDRGAQLAREVDSYAETERTAKGQNTGNKCCPPSAKVCTVKQANFGGKKDCSMIVCPAGVSPPSNSVSLQPSVWLYPAGLCG